MKTIDYPSDFPPSVRSIIDNWVSAWSRGDKTVNIRKTPNDYGMYLVHFTIKAKILTKSDKLNPSAHDTVWGGFANEIFNTIEQNHQDNEPYDFYLSWPFVVASGSSHYSFLDRDIEVFLDRLRREFDYHFVMIEHVLHDYLNEVFEG